MKKLKNDKERIAFLEDYRNMDNGWRLWKEDQDLWRRWWRLDLTDDCSFVVEEQCQTFAYPEVHDAWCVVHWYIVEAWDRPFANWTASRSIALARLKEVQRG